MIFYRKLRMRGVTFRAKRDPPDKTYPGELSMRSGKSGIGSRFAAISQRSPPLPPVESYDA